MEISIYFLVSLLWRLPWTWVPACCWYAGRWWRMRGDSAGWSRSRTWRRRNQPRGVRPLCCTCITIQYSTVKYSIVQYSTEYYLSKPWACTILGTQVRLFLSSLAAADNCLSKCSCKRSDLTEDDVELVEVWGAECSLQLGVVVTHLLLSVKADVFGVEYQGEGQVESPFKFLIPIWQRVTELMVDLHQI